MENFEETGLRLLYPAGRISAEIQRLADEITADYQGKDLLLIVVLKGAFFFAADLARRIRLPLMLDFVRLSSYSGTETTGTVSLVKDIATSVSGKHLLVVEDIVDTGMSLDFLVRALKGKEPESLRVCVLIDKQGRRRVAAPADYTGMVCDDRFLVGYGLDLNERYRELPHIYELVTNPSHGGLNDSPM